MFYVLNKFVFLFDIKWNFMEAPLNSLGKLASSQPQNKTNHRE